MKLIERFRKIWHDPVWSKVIASGINRLFVIIGVFIIVVLAFVFGYSPRRYMPNKETIAPQVPAKIEQNRELTIKMPVRPHSIYPLSPLPRDKDQQRYEKPVPWRDGNDILIPMIILQSISGFDESKTVYAATYKNNWLNISNPETKYDVIEASILKREGNEWRAIGLAGTRFHPVQLIDSTLTKNRFKPGNISWARIEDLNSVYGNTWEKFSKEFIDPNPPGPCFLIR